MYIRTYIDTCVYTYIHACIHMYIHAYVYDMRKWDVDNKNAVAAV